LVLGAVGVPGVEEVLVEFDGDFFGGVGLFGAAGVCTAAAVILDFGFWILDCWGRFALGITRHG
jgi:hypothetical protein